MGMRVLKGVGRRGRQERIRLEEIIERGHELRGDLIKDEYGLGRRV